MDVLKRAVVFAAATALGTAPSVAGAAGGDTLRRFAPVGKWVMDYADDSCRLSGRFSDGRDEITLAFERFGPDESPSIWVIGDAIRARLGVSEVRLAFAPASPTLSYRLFRAKLVDGKPFLYLVESTGRQRTIAELSAREMAQVPSIPEGTLAKERSAELERAAAVQEVQLLGGFSERITLLTGPLSSAMKAMQECTNELLTHWNIDAAAHQKLTRIALPLNPQKLAAAFTYPTQALAEGRGGLIRYRLMIDAAGSPTSCAVAGSGTPSDLGQATCRTLMAAGKFTPARDANGLPIASFYLGRALFR